MRLNNCYFKIIHFLHPYYHLKVSGDILKKSAKNNDACFNEIIWFIIMKTSLKMKNASNRYDINRPTPRYRRKYTKYKTFLSMMIVICIKQHQSNIWVKVFKNEQSKICGRQSWPIWSYEINKQQRLSWKTVAYKSMYVVWD